MEKKTKLDFIEWEGEYFLVERPGQLGKNKKEAQKRWDEEYPGWRIGYLIPVFDSEGNFERHIVVGEQKGWEIYEQGYIDFFQRNLKLKYWISHLHSVEREDFVNKREMFMPLYNFFGDIGVTDYITRFVDVWDTDIGNVNARLDYSATEKEKKNHVHDIAIRNALVKIGRYFSEGLDESFLQKAEEVYITIINSYQDEKKKSKLEEELKALREKGILHVRFIDSLGYIFNPGVVPLHDKKIILPYESSEEFGLEKVVNYSGWNPWWLENSVEAFYQNNKGLFVPK